MFEIKKVVKKGDYLYALVPDHPNATKNGYVLMHRVVVENRLGRLLSKSEIVHHKDHDKKNNSIENLEVLTQSEHARLHRNEHPMKLHEFVCPECGKVFSKKYHPSEYRKYGVFCSRHCSGVFSARMQHSSR